MFRFPDRAPIAYDEMRSPLNRLRVGAGGLFMLATAVAWFRTDDPGVLLLLGRLQLLQQLLLQLPVDFLDRLLLDLFLDPRGVEAKFGRGHGAGDPHRHLPPPFLVGQQVRQLGGAAEFPGEVGRQPQIESEIEGAVETDRPLGGETGIGPGNGAVESDLALVDGE